MQTLLQSAKEAGIGTAIRFVTSTCLTLLLFPGTSLWKGLGVTLVFTAQSFILTFAIRLYYASRKPKAEAGEGLAYVTSDPNDGTRLHVQASGQYLKSYPMTRAQIVNAIHGLTKNLK